MSVIQKLIACCVVILAFVLKAVFSDGVTSNPLPNDARPADAAAVPATPAIYLPAPLFHVEVIASGLRVPWSVKFLPDGRVFFTERDGRVRVIENETLREEPALVVPDIRVWSKMGLLGLEIDPNFTANHFVYTSECYGTGNGRDDNEVRVVRYRESRNRLVEPTVIFDHIPCFHNHAGGRLLFGPDGKLYITTGDADQPLLTQRLDTLHGKILRINPDGSIPLDNPFVSDKDANSAIWTYGHRNPQGICFQPGTGLLFETEHGPDGGDEINLIQKGHNYGWPLIDKDRAASGMDTPLRQFTPSVAPAECVIYDGTMFPALRGDMLICCLRGESILRVRFAGTKVEWVERLIFKQFGRLRELTVAPDGALWITTSEFDEPEGRRTAGFDQIIRLTPGSGTVATIDRPPVASEMARPVGRSMIYAARCLSCHGDGNAVSLSTNLFDRKWQTISGGDDDIRKIIRSGSIARGMPAFAGSLTPQDIDDLITYIHEREAAAAMR